MTKELLTEEGKKYAKWIFLTHRCVVRVPFLGKYVMGTLASVVYSVILKQGAIAHASSKRKTKMSGMRNGVGVSGRQASGEVREMRIHNQGIFGDGPMDSRNLQPNAEGEKDEERFTD